MCVRANRGDGCIIVRESKQNPEVTGLLHVRPVMSANIFAVSSVE